MVAILAAADRVLSEEPGATMERIAEAAGVARTTVHRHFATRDELIDELSVWAATGLEDAVNQARPQTAPPLVALYQATVNVLNAKSTWAFAMSSPASNDEAERIRHRVRATCDELLRRAQADGELATDADIEWTRRVYYALIHEAAKNRGEFDADQLASRVVQTLLHGVAPR